jgi:hypothetical protein
LNPASADSVTQKYIKWRKMIYFIGVTDDEGKKSGDTIKKDIYWKG